MITDANIHKQLLYTLKETHFDQLGKRYEGKVRDNYSNERKQERTIVTTDRISAFDVVLGTIPFKGQVLNQMALFWFAHTTDIINNHVLSSPDPNVMVVRELTSFPVEMVVRGYLTGVTKTSVWYNYSNGVRLFCGNKLPEGMKKDQRFAKPMLTPTTKAEKGGHDESISPEEIVQRGLIDRETFAQLTSVSFQLFERGTALAAKQGIILVDTKYEFGYYEEKDVQGKKRKVICLMDEIHTPDSSRFWFADEYKERFTKGLEQKKIDKEYVRKWYADQGYIGDGAPPQLQDDIRVEAAKRYIQAYELITGQIFSADVGDVIGRIKRNLGIK
ncbi:phosphoribosylaminoimidazolesuccinocarboxamide synthase [Candidatus Woesearchaeota archaeon]|nr:phosphoribosylaminoimidazolesuccinocarboxamide synthase [Candidatus Woesearchaeota archaeon]